MKPKLKKLKGVVFDFDGTIVSIHIDFKGIKQILLEKAYQLNLRLPDTNKPILELLESIKKNNNKSMVDGFINDIKDILLEQEVKSAQKALPLPGSIKIMRNLRKKGVKIGIFTRNCPQAVHKVVKKFNIPCDVLLTRDDVTKVKPAREHLEQTIRQLGLTTEEVIVVGDHTMDIKSAKNSNVLSCGIISENVNRYEFEKAGADFIFEKIEDIGYLFDLKPINAGKLSNNLLGYLLKNYVKNDGCVIMGAQIGVDCSIFKTDTDVLFAKSDPITLVGQDIGNYLVNVNINDIAVMGGIPRWFLCSLIFRAGTTFSEIEDVFSQICCQCEKHKLNWVGGHTEISEGVKNNIACGFLVGSSMKKKSKAPQIVKKGDRVFLARAIGIEAVSIIAREKYEFLKKNFSENSLLKMMDSINNPGINVLKEARLLWENFNIKAMHDPTEGGISAALYEIASRCDIGITVNKKSLVFYPGLIRLAHLFRFNPYGIISSGCIVGIISSEDSTKMVKFMHKKGIKCTIIGETTDEKGVYLQDGIKKLPFPIFDRDEITNTNSSSKI